ncbi:MFS transporter [Paenibacillus lactis]|uniref:MFS transporter n=1 Tax=Paenibacillus lactis TaxID=228574 RepID=UPI0036AFA26C
MILLRNSLGIYWLAFGVFIMATAEIVVSGILAMISEDLKVSVGMAGQLVTVYALVIAIGSPVLMAITARIERKRLLILSFLTFIIGNGIGYFSPDFSILVIARIVQAASASVFTVVALTMGSNLAAPGRQGTAIGTILMGAGTALAVGVPLGTLIGGHWGWRFVFVFIIMLALLSVIGIAYTVPISKHQESLSLKQQLGVLRNRRIVSGLLITLFWVTGYQMMFTYITPFLQETANLDATRISAALF